MIQVVESIVATAYHARCSINDANAGTLSTAGDCPALVLNADFRPLSYFLLSLWPWQEAVKAVFLDRVNIISEYDREVRSPSISMRLPSVIALKSYIPMARRPAFTWFNVFLRDRFVCQYCGGAQPSTMLTFDHVVPRSRGGYTTWENVVTACTGCNLAKGDKLAGECGMQPRRAPCRPTNRELQEHGRLGCLSCAVKVFVKVRESRVNKLLNYIGLRSCVNVCEFR